MSAENKKYYRSLINTPGWDCIFRSSDNSIVATSCPDLPESERYEITVEIVRALNCHAELLEALQELVAHVESCKQSWIADGSTRGTKEHGLAVCLNNRAGDMITAAIARATSNQ